MADVLKEITVSYKLRNIVNANRTIYIDEHIIPIHITDISNIKLVYNELSQNNILRNQIINFHKSLERVSKIDAASRAYIGHRIPWKSTMPTRCITCNEKVDLLNYSIFLKSKYRILIDISEKIENQINYKKYVKKLDCCKCVY